MRLTVFALVVVSATALVSLHQKSNRRSLSGLPRGGAFDSSIPSDPASGDATSTGLSSTGGDDIAKANDIESNETTSSKMGPNASSPGILRRSLPGLPWHQLPNILTYLRCLSIPIFGYLFHQANKHVLTASIFAFASFTDWLDGYLARRWDITSAFGAFLDPVADKLMVSTALILLSGKYGGIISIPSAIILAREIAVSALREWMAQRNMRDAVKVGFQGKVKTALTMVSLTLLLLCGDDKSKFYLSGLSTLYASAIVTISSGSVYFRAAAPVLLEQK